jgi:hypothetical protein
MFRILKSSLNESCRELNFEQLLFWGQFVKMSFSSSKFEFELNYKIWNSFIKGK